MQRDNFLGLLYSIETCFDVQKDALQAFEKFEKPGLCGQKWMIN